MAGQAVQARLSAVFVNGPWWDGGTGVDLGCNNGPVDGFTAGGVTYVLFQSPNEASCAAAGPQPTLTVGRTSGEDFSSISVAAGISDVFMRPNTLLDPDQQTLWMFGVSKHRNSAVYLAKSTVDSFTDRSSWQYYRGPSSYVSDELSAQPVVDETCVGELSVRPHPAMGWVMAYNCFEKHAVLVRTAPAPDGPWSAATVLFSPADGYGAFMHTANAGIHSGSDDGLADYNSQDGMGSFYGAYFLPDDFSTDAPGVYSLVFVMQSWNPYALQAMRATMAVSGATGLAGPVLATGAAPANLDFSLGSLAGWTSTGNAFAFVHAAAPDGVSAGLVSSVGPLAATGSLAIDSPTASSFSTLTFRVAGTANPRADGFDCSVKLVVSSTGEVLRQTWPVWTTSCQHALDCDPSAAQSCVSKSGVGACGANESSCYCAPSPLFVQAE